MVPDGHPVQIATSILTRSLPLVVPRCGKLGLQTLVIFYDGINDVYAAYQLGRPGVHQNCEEIAARFERSEHHLLVEWLKTSHSFSLFERLVAGLSKSQ